MSKIAHPQTHHAGDIRRPARDLDQVGDQRHRTDAEGEPEQRQADGQTHGDERPERHVHDDHGRDDAVELGGPCLGLLVLE